MLLSLNLMMRLRLRIRLSMRMTVPWKQGTVAMEKLVEKLGNTEDRVECKKLKKELEEARMKLVGLGQLRGQDTALAVRECTFAGFMKCNPIVFHGFEGVVELRRWFKKTESVFEISECAEGKKVKFVAATLEGPSLTWWKTKKKIEHELWNLKVKEYDVVAYTQRFNGLALMCPRMVEHERVKVDAYILGLMDNIKGEVTSSKPADLNEVVRIAHKLMEQKSQARDATSLEGKKRKWENLQGGYSSGKVNQRDNSHHALQSSQKQRNARAMVTELPLCERYFTRHVGHCTIKCHKCGKVGHKVILGTDVQIRFSKKKLEKFMVELMLLRMLSRKFNRGSNRSFVNTRFSSLLDIKLIKIEDSYEVELADGRIVSMNTVLKDCTLSLVNHVFEIDLMSIELGTFDVIIGMDWLVKHDAVIICGEKVVRIPYGNKTLIVKGDKGVSRLKVISCIKARKYVEQGCHLFLAHVTESKSKEKRMEDVPVIRDFPKVFLEELPGLPPPRQVEFRIDLVPGAAPVALKELSVQLQELLEKGFIHPSSSP
ncbi:putative reverse transcriptase domain-containing protein [Tanacetum coccineum]